jgi:hypothetical protein
MSEKNITLPVDTAERLMDVAGRAEGITDAPTLMMFSEVRRLIEEAKRAQ